MTPEAALLGATALHAGFQLTVTAIVYPALFRAPEWRPAHDFHTRAITPLVVVVYGVLVLACGWTLVDGATVAGTWVALAGVVVAFGATALRAAPLHGRLGEGRHAALVRSLRAADLVRAAGALVALAGAVVAAA
jgi:hypothetical protein